MVLSSYLFLFGQRGDFHIITCKSIFINDELVLSGYKFYHEKLSSSLDKLIFNQKTPLYLLPRHNSGNALMGSCHVWESSRLHCVLKALNQI